MYLADEISAPLGPGCERAVWRGLCLLLFPLLLIALAFRAEADPAEIGEWGPLIENFPVPAVHSIMLHTGKVLFFRGDGEDEGGVGAEGEGADCADHQAKACSRESHGASPTKRRCGAS